MTSADVTDEEMLVRAREAKERAYAPFSEYKIGASLLAGGEIYLGANIEVSGWSTSIHAEMLATYNAVFSGAKEFKCLAVSLQGSTEAAPCGLCQHTLAQFTRNVRIIVDSEKDKEFTEYELQDLLGPSYRPGTRENFPPESDM